MAFTSSYTPGLIQQSEYYYGTPDVLLTGSFTGSFSGDGSQLTNIISASYALTASHALNSSGGGIFTDSSGYKQTINNLIISQSNTSSSLSVINSGSTVFDVQGSVGQLFEVADGLDGVLMSVNDISGIPILTVSSSGDVFLAAGSTLQGTAATASFVPGVSAAFPFTGSGAISGSLNINGSGSGIFDVDGTVGSLFSVNDGLDGILMSVNDISGLPLFEVSSSGDVEIHEGNISGSSTSTASFGTYIGDGSGLTGLISSSYALTASHALNVSVPTLQQVTTAGNTTDQALIVTGSSIFRTTTVAGAGGRIELSNQSYSGVNNPKMSFVDSGDNNNVVIGHSANDGLIQVYDQPSQLRTVIAANFVCFDPGTTGTAGVYFGVTSSAADGSNRSYVRIKESGYSGIPYHTLNLAHKSGGTTSGSITLGGISQTTSTSAPSIQIASNDGVRVVNFGGPGFNHSNGQHNNYLKYGLQIGGDYTGYTSNMPLTDGSLIMSGSTGAFSLKSVSSEAEIKTNNGDTTLTLGTTSSFSYVSASAFVGDGSQLTGLPTPTFISSGSTSASAAPNTGVVVEHSGSTAFSVIGDVGTLFSVDDSLTGTLFSINDITGIPQLEVSASGKVEVGKGPLIANTFETGSISNGSPSSPLQMTFPSASSAQLFGVGGYFRASWDDGDSDHIWFEDDNIRLSYDLSGVDIEGTIMTDPASGEIHISLDKDGTRTALDKQVSDGIFDLNAVIGTDQTDRYIFAAPTDPTWPYYKIEVTRTSATHGSGFYAIVEKFI